MTFKEQLAADLADPRLFFDTNAFAETVTYTPVSGAARTIPALIEYGDPEEGGLPGMDALHTEASMEILADATNGMAQVAANDAVTIGAETWRVLYARKIDDGRIWRCRLSRSTR